MPIRIPLASPPITGFEDPEPGRASPHSSFVARPVLQGLFSIQGAQRIRIGFLPQAFFFSKSILVFSLLAVTADTLTGIKTTKSLSTRKLKRLTCPPAPRWRNVTVRRPTRGDGDYIGRHPGTCLEYDPVTLLGGIGRVTHRVSDGQRSGVQSNRIDVDIEFGSGIPFI